MFFLVFGIVEAVFLGVSSLSSDFFPMSSVNPFLSPFLFFEVMISFFSDESEEKGKRWGFWYHRGRFLFFTWSLFEVMQSEEVKNREGSDESEESSEK